MKGIDEDYDKFTEVMGRSHDAPAYPDLLAERIIGRVLGESRKAGSRLTIQKFIFGWTSVAWVRRSLAIASLLLVGMFAYQQFEILTGIRDINYRMKEGGGFEVRPSASYDQGKVLQLATSPSDGLDSIKVSVEDISRLIESYNKLEISWERINRILQRNPDLLRKIEKEYSESLVEAGSKSKI